jgi:hypothetical protein
MRGPSSARDLPMNYQESEFVGSFVLSIRTLPKTEKQIEGEQDKSTGA